jgi:hypothetical protein
LRKSYRTFSAERQSLGVRGTANTRSSPRGGPAQLWLFRAAGNHWIVDAGIGEFVEGGVEAEIAHAMPRLR